MRSRWLRWSCIGTLICITSAGAEEVRILDWNIFTYGTPGSPEHEAMVRIVQALDPHIILFQEANNSAGRLAFTNQFSSQYPYNFLGAPSHENPKNQIWSVFPLTDAGQIFTADPDGGTFERPTVWADVDVLPDELGAELRVYSVHYKSGTAARDRTLRLNQATDDAAHITALITSIPQARVYYAGDLNALVGEPPLEKLKEPQTTLSRLPIINPNNGSAMTRWPSGRTIDHIFFSSTLSGFIHDQFIFHSETYPAGTLPPPVQPTDSQTASDHLVLFATVDIQPGGPSQPLLINEVQVRHSGAADTHEFIELSGTPGRTLNGMSVLVIDGSAAGNPGRVDRIFSLNGHVIPPSGYYLLGNSSLNPDFLMGSQNILKNSTQTILLVQNATVGFGFDIDTNNDGNPETSVGTIRDSIAFASSGIWNGDHTYFDAPVFGPDGTAVPAGAARCPDAIDTGTAFDWAGLSFTRDGRDGHAVPSPGAHNNAMWADFTGDCDVDEDDLDFLRACHTGSSVPWTDPACAAADIDGDGDVDIEDFAIFQLRYTGPR